MICSMDGSVQRPAVVFIPGFMQPGDAWAPVADGLPERYPSVLLDHSENSFEGRLSEIASAGEGAVLCGYSMGGRLALHAAVRAPGRYAGLVTVGASAGIDAPATREARAEADARLASWMETQPIEQIVEVWERQPLFADQSEQLIQAQRPGRLRQDPRALSMLLRTAGQGTLDALWDDLHELRIPLLALAGALDERYAEIAKRLARTVPQGAAQVVENAGHAAQLQRPEAVAMLLADFLDQHLGQRVV
jgi:2-succinyl-6-hydroxy-2,4-cyclohexadiene-1-carboxylate synthase